MYSGFDGAAYKPDPRDREISELRAEVERLRAERGDTHESHAVLAREVATLRTMLRHVLESNLTAVEQAYRIEETRDRLTKDGAL